MVVHKRSLQKSNACINVGTNSWINYTDNDMASIGGENRGAREAIAILKFKASP